MRTAVGISSLAILLTVGLTACGPLSTDPAETAKPSPSATRQPTATPTPEPSATPTPDPSAAPTPLGVNCEQLVTLDDMYAFSPSFGLLGQGSPAAGSPASAAVAASGIACDWVHESSGDVISFAAALPGSGIADARAAAAATGTATSAFAAEGYFGVIDGMPTAQAFDGQTWVIVASPVFGSAEEVATLVDDVLENLR